MLVVGPNPAFMEYVSHVLPTLGEENADQRAVAELVDGAEVTRADPLDVQRLKADIRLGDVVQRAVELSSQGEPQELVVRLEGRFVGVEADEVAELLAEARGELGFSAAARERFRMNVLRRFYEDYGARLGGQAFRAFDEIERALRKDGRMTRFLDRVWPALKPEQVVRRLLATRERLAEAADGLLDADVFDETRIAVLTPREAKGMEFDHVVVVEPALIVEEAAEGQGLRELYVALTRPTTTLVLVHSPAPTRAGPLRFRVRSQGARCVSCRREPRSVTTKSFEGTGASSSSGSGPSASKRTFEPSGEGTGS